jgi:hypothetical protein
MKDKGMCVYNIYTLEKAEGTITLFILLMYCLATETQ